ncbi:TonB-dependent receptor (plasmid) [Novosphingobium sp. THN1]|uniref:TonB-dependent receptor n=1 Tax=Novosphingobium sp. THN1 TaxID=1016987 RepID=UPI000E4BB30D|nr:TonB-dependent receptor [Novosphingobium sp. THN1]AXU21007.1 TonB-dependent receptor [Novosphingobium sp. THN1]
MRTTAARRMLAVAMTTTALGLALPAFATEADEPQAVQADETTAADAGDTGAIIVTARRRSETLQSTPVAITAVNTAFLESKAAVNIGDLQGAAPGLLITQQNSGAQAANISIRGLTYADIEKSQTPTVGVLVDGVVIGTNTGQLQDAFDIAQLEVLRGPQGTLFGANTIGGVINIQRTKPTMKPGLKAEATFAKFGTFSTKLLANYGNEESWGVKAWYFHNETDGFYKNVTRNVDAGWSNGENYGASLLFKPVGSGFDAQLTVAQVEQVFDPVVSSLANSSEAFCSQPTLDFIGSLSGLPAGSILAAPARECNRNNTTDLYTTFGSAASSNYKAPEATLEMNYDLGGVTLTSITGWRKSTEAQTQDFDGMSVDLYYVDRRQHYEQWSQELRAAGNLLDGLDYVVGGFYFHSKYDLTQWSRVLANSPNIAPTLFDRNSQHVEGLTESYAVFGDFNWKVAEQIRVSFGGRYSHDRKELFNGFAGGKLIDPDSVQKSQFVPVGTGKASFNKFTPKVGIDWRPNQDVMVYASWSRGYRSGGFSPRAATAATASTPFQPETVDAYEVGVKLSAFDRKLELNLAGFVSDYKDMQQNLTVPGGPTGNQTITGNVPGGALIKGIEADGTLRLTENFRITGSIAIMDSHFRNFVTCGAYAAGPVATNACGTGLVPFNYSANRLIYAPDFTASLGAEYVAPTGFGDITTNVGWRHISPYDEQLSAASLTPTLNGSGQATLITVGGNDPRVRTTTQDLVDASMTFNFDIDDAKAYLRVFTRNLLNEKTTTHAFTVAGLWSFGMALEPRTYGVTAGFKF